MVRLFYYGSIILVLISLGVSWLIFPSDDEIAFLQYKDQLYSSALNLYEAQIKKGDYSPRVVIPLTDLYLKYGDVDKAIDLMEVFVRKNPVNLEVRGKLGLYYQYAQRYDDYRKNLEETYQISHNPELLRKLADIYNFNGDFNRQQNVLEVLTTRFKAEKQDYIDLAYLYAGKQEYRNAILTLTRYAQLQSRPDPEIVELTINLLIDDGRPREAFDVARSASEKGEPEDRYRYAVRFQARDQAKYAYQLIDRNSESIATDPGRLPELISLEIALNKSDKALARLKKLYSEGQLPQSLVGSFVILLIQKKDRPLLKKILNDIPLENLNQFQITGLIKLFDEANDKEAIHNIETKLTPALRDEFPTIDMVITMTAHPDDIKTKARTVRKSLWLTDEQRFQLAMLYGNGNLHEEAQQILTDVHDLYGVNRPDIGDIADLYIKQDLAEQGLQLIDKALPRVQKIQKPSYELAALLLAIAAGQDKRVYAYLNRYASQDSQVLIDLYYLAQSRNNIAIMLATSSRLIQKDKTDRRYIGFYVESLLASRHYRKALPLLKQLAGQKNKSWIYAYADTLQQLGRMDEWANFWAEQAGTDYWNRTEKRSIAYALMEHGYQEKAKPVFEQLSENRRFDDPDVIRLVNLWHATSDPAGLTWLANRIIEAGKNEKENWFRLYYDLAHQLGRHSSIEDLVSKQPDLVKLATQLDLDHGNSDMAYNRLVKMYRENRLPSSSFGYLVRLVIERQDRPFLQKLIPTLKDEVLDPDVQINLFNLLIKNATTTELIEYRTGLGSSYFQSNSPVSLLFDIAEKKHISSDRIVELASDRQTTDYQRLIMAGFLFDHGLRNQSEIMVKSIKKLTGFSDADLPQVSELYLKVGRPETGLALFKKQRSLMAQQADISSEQLDSIQLVLSAAAGHTAEVNKHLLAGKPSIQLLTDLYYVSMDFKQPQIALIAASRLYNLRPAPRSLALKVTAQLANQKRREALPGIEELVRHNPKEWEYIYLDTLEKLGKDNQIKDYLLQVFHRPGISESRKQEIAFDLLSKGFREDAEKMFLDLAKNKPADSSLVQQLLYLWGARPRPYDTAWIKHRLETAPVQNKAGWLHILINIGQSNTAIQYLESNLDKMESDSIDILLELYAADRKKEKFKKIAQKILNTEKRIDRLKKIAKWSRQLDLTDTAIAYYEKAFEVAPNDREVLNEYGKTAFYQGDFEKSAKMLRTFMNSGGLDYISAYLYAEIMWREKKTGIARKYYQKSADLIDLLLSKSLSDDILAAKIQFRLGHKEEAIRQYRNLMEKYPDNADLKADFAESLMEMGLTGEAEKLLSDI